MECVFYPILNPTIFKFLQNRIQDYFMVKHPIITSKLGINTKISPKRRHSMDKFHGKFQAKRAIFAREFIFAKQFIAAIFA
jgi:hypothetical protein